VVLPGGVRWQRPAGGAEGADPPGRGDALLLLRPENLVMVPPGQGTGQGTGQRTGQGADQGAGDGSPLPGTVTDRRFAGPVTTWRVQVDGVDTPLEVTAASDRGGTGGGGGRAEASPAGPRDGFHPAPGEAVGLTVRRPGLGMLFPAQSAPDLP
ncbi:MAG: hypothetical protein EA350_13585, partial [Gemmatimonadales bacterium]